MPIDGRARGLARALASVPAGPATALGGARRELAGRKAPATPATPAAENPRDAAAWMTTLAVEVRGGELPEAGRPELPAPASLGKSLPPNLGILSTILRGDQVRHSRSRRYSGRTRAPLAGSDPRMTGHPKNQRFTWPPMCRRRVTAVANEGSHGVICPCRHLSSMCLTSTITAGHLRASRLSSPRSSRGPASPLAQSFSLLQQRSGFKN